MTDIKKSLLEEAESIINGSRRETYGAPEQNFERISALWETFLAMRMDQTLGVVNIEPRDVALMMILMKIARLAETPDHRDSIVDMIGYAACYGELVLADSPVNKGLGPLEEYLSAPTVVSGRDGPIVPKRDTTPPYCNAKIGDEVHFLGTGEIKGPYYGKVTDIDDFHAWMRLQIDGEWVANDRIVAII